MVNLDRRLLDVMWEARWLRHLGYGIPQAAQAILMQQEKFGIYFEQLSHALEVDFRPYRSHKAPSA